MRCPCYDQATYSNPGHAAVKHHSIHLEIQTLKRILVGYIQYEVEIYQPGVEHLILDTRHLEISKCEVNGVETKVSLNFSNKRSV